MSRVVTISLWCVFSVIACRGAERPGFEVVRVPELAYLSADAATTPDAGEREAGPPTRGSGTLRLVMPPNCTDVPKREPTEDEAASDFPECPNYKSQRLIFDTDRTKRAREKMGRPICCYVVPQGDYGE